MADISYPRPHDPERRPWASLGIAAVLLALPGVVNGLEVLLIGEELSPLGDRTLAWSRAASGSWNDLAPKIGSAVLLLSILRIAAGIALARDRRWGAALFLALGVPGLLADALCFSSPVFFAFWGALDLAALIACVRWRR